MEPEYNNDDASRCLFAILNSLFFLFPHLRLMIEIELLKFYGSDCQQIPSVDADLSSSFRASLIFFFVKRMTY